MRLKITMHRCDVWTCMSAANACWIVLCKCMLDIKCSVLRGWSCAITKSFEFWLRTDEKMGLTLSHANIEGCDDLRIAWSTAVAASTLRSSLYPQSMVLRIFETPASEEMPR